MSGFDRDTFVKEDLHRQPAKDHWLLKGGFKPSIRNDSLSKTVQESGSKASLGADRRQSLAKYDNTP